MAEPGRDSRDHMLDRAFGEHRRRQATLGLELTAAQRLRWLEETMATMRRWLGRAREPDAHARPDP